MDFQQLPDDIKNLIFSKNRSWTRQEIDRNKRLYLEVIDHLHEIIETTDQIYYEANEEEEIIDTDWGFGNAMLDCIREENIEYKYQVEEDIEFNNYYEIII
tara:strand:+ start:865 stop:1167 length:303 start_codon:yes stop_codon:yes gene_type:complete